MPSPSSARVVGQFYLPLPVELIREIIKDLDRVSYVAAVARASKTFHDLAIPILYHSVYLEKEENTLSFIRCMKASVENAKRISRLFMEFDTMIHFDDLMSVPGLRPQALFFETTWGKDIDPQVVSSWEARPKHMVVFTQSTFSHINSRVTQRMALFSQLTHLYLEDVILDDATLSFCLELRTLTHVCVPIYTDMDRTDALRQIHGFLDMPLMEVVVIDAMVFGHADYQQLFLDENGERCKDVPPRFLTRMGFPKGDLFPFLAEIPDERLYVVAKLDMFSWFEEGISPWELARRPSTMPWRDAVKVPSKGSKED